MRSLLFSSQVLDASTRRCRRGLTRYTTFTPLLRSYVLSLPLRYRSPHTAVVAVSPHLVEQDRFEHTCLLVLSTNVSAPHHLRAPRPTYCTAPHCTSANNLPFRAFYGFPSTPVYTHTAAYCARATALVPVCLHACTGGFAAFTLRRALSSRLPRLLCYGYRAPPPTRALAPPLRADIGSQDAFQHTTLVANPIAFGLRISAAALFPDGTTSCRSFAHVCCCGFALRRLLPHTRLLYAFCVTSCAPDPPRRIARRTPGCRRGTELVPPHAPPCSLAFYHQVCSHHPDATPRFPSLSLDAFVRRVFLRHNALCLLPRYFPDIRVHARLTPAPASLPATCTGFASRTPRAPRTLAPRTALPGAFAACTAPSRARTRRTRAARCPLDTATAFPLRCDAQPNCRT